MFGVRVGQPLEIVNSDPTLHNIHAMPKANQEFNNGQPIQGMKMTHTFTAKEVMVPFKCDVHGWMNAYVGVLDHPYFAVTGADGTFKLKGLPPGTYTIEAWHEKLGATTQSVTLGAKETKEVTFTFKVRRAATDWQTGGQRQVGTAERPAAPHPPGQPALPAREDAPPVRAVRRRLHGAARARRQPRHQHRIPDWPSPTGPPRYGWNMFTFPPSKWVGGIFYEHGHRLIASTVGFLTIVLAAWLWRAEPRRWMKRLGVAALGAGDPAGRCSAA